MAASASGRCGLGLASLLLVASTACTTIDPGPNFKVANPTFDANYFYCHIEPGLIFQYKCGPGDPSMGDKANGCHFNASVVSGMALTDHPPVDCGGGDTVVDLTQIGTGSAAESNYEAVSFEMSDPYQNAPLFVRPTGNTHPRMIFSPDDPTVNALLGMWATQP